MQKSKKGVNLDYFKVECTKLNIKRPKELLLLCLEHAADGSKKNHHDQSDIRLEIVCISIRLIIC